jgi:hypothetical protein
MIVEGRPGLTPHLPPITIDGDHGDRLTADVALSGGRRIGTPIRCERSAAAFLPAGRFDLPASAARITLIAWPHLS